MIRNAKLNFPALSLLIVLFSTDGPSNSQENEPFIQADVYNTLFEAHVQCDDNLDQSRSEFITDMFERNRGNRVSMELVRQLLAHRMQVAKQFIADKTKERELYVSEILDREEEPSEDGLDSAEASKLRHEKIRQIDDFLRPKRQYVEVHECVLQAIQNAPEK
jgi:hypothetical protein